MRLLDCDLCSYATFLNASLLQKSATLARTVTIQKDLQRTDQQIVSLSLRLAVRQHLFITTLLPDRRAGADYEP
jgi:hypothetical protein